MTQNATFSERLFSDIRKRLATDQQIRRNLPEGGRIHIDRQLPFICVYRRPPRRSDGGTERFVMAQASYIIAPASKRYQADVDRLLSLVIEVLSPEFGNILVVEVWSTNSNGSNGNHPNGLPAPEFTLITTTGPVHERAIEAVQRRLARIRVNRQTATVRHARWNRPEPPGLAPLLLKPRELKRHTRLGIAIAPVYRDPETGDVLPLVLKAMVRSFTTALQRLFFQFARNQTDHYPTHYQTLGRRALVKAAWDVDTRLAEIDDRFNLLLQVSPINMDTAWTDFKQRQYEQRPTFYYRPLAVDPSELKRRLWSIQVERLEDPTLEYVFQEKRLETDTHLDMLLEMNTSQFKYSSLRLFGAVDADLLATARQLLDTIPARSREKRGKSQLSAFEFREQAQGAIDRYREQYPALTATATVRDDISGLVVSNGHLLIGKRGKIPTSRVEALIHHEVSTHVLTYFNGLAQPFKQLHTGLAGYSGLQEGLAVLAEYLVGGLSRPRMRLLAGRVVAAHCLEDGATFVETFRCLRHDFRFASRLAFTITARIYRGGGYTKDQVYLDGLIQVLDYVQSGGELAPLLLGKIATHHIPIILELQRRGVLCPAPLQPYYLQDEDAQERLANISRLNLTIFDLTGRTS